MFVVTATVEDKTIVLHDDTVEDQRVKLIEPTLELEKNTAGKFTFKLAPNNQGYSKYEFVTEVIDHISADGTPVTRRDVKELDMVSRMNSTIRIYRDGTEIWEGRVLSEEKDWWNLRVITCEGELAYLNDACQQLRRYADITLSQFLDEVLKIYNTKVEKSKMFYKGVVTVHNAAQSIGWRDTKYENTMETVNNLVRDFGGILRIRKIDGKRYLDWLADYPNVSTQEINFGKNLLDFKCTWNLSKLCTVLLPTGKSIEDEGQDAIGDALIPLEAGLHDHSDDPRYFTEGKLLEVDSETHKVKVTNVPTLPGYKVGTYNITSDPENPTSVYLSSRLHGGYISLVCYGGQAGSGEEIYRLAANQETGYEFKDFVDQKVDLPGGTHSIMVCGFGDDIPLIVKSCVKAKSKTIEAVTMTPENAGGVPTLGQTLWLNPENNKVDVISKGDAPYPNRYKTAVYNLEYEEEGETKAIDKVWITCRLGESLVSWVCMDDYGGGGGQLMYNQVGAGTDENPYTDYVDQEVAIPAGSKSIIIASYGDGMPLVCKRNLEEKKNEKDAPLGKYLTIEECDDDPGWHTKGSNYITHPDLVKKYGWIEKQLSFDAPNTTGPIPDQSEQQPVDNKDVLYSMAKTYLKENMFDEMTIELSAIDLKTLGVDAQYINLLDRVMVRSEPHALEKLFPVDKMSIPLLDVGNQKFTLGTTSSESLTGVNNEFNQDVIKKLTVTSSETLNNAKKDAAALIGMATNGFVSMIEDEETGGTKEIVISNTKDPTECTSCWIWNVNGLGHSDHYPLKPGDTVNVAMTMDGSIVADRITTGVMTAILLRGIKAVFGGMDGEDGSILVKSGSPGQVSPSGDSLDFCVEHKMGGIHFGVLSADTTSTLKGIHVESGTSGDFTVTDFARIQSDKLYETADPGQPSNLVHGLVIDSKVLALDIDQLWISSKSSFSGGGTDATIGCDSTSAFWFMEDNGQGTGPGQSYIGPFRFRHGIITPDIPINNS